jgi:uncharacterized protein YegL
MRADHSDITIIVDASGSMFALAAETISGINNFVEKQKATPGTATLTIVTFNENVTARPAIDIASAGKFDNYHPNGTTALLDAVGKTITEIGTRIKAMPEADRPGSVVVVIVTDGAENASREYTRDKVKEMVTHQTEQYKWSFVFMGSDISTFAEASSIGIGANFTAAYAATRKGMVATYSLMAEKTAGLRQARSVGDYSTTMAWTEQERGTLLDKTKQ